MPQHPILRAEELLFCRMFQDACSDRHVSMILFCTGVGFSLKRTTNNQPDIQTLQNHKRLDVIRSLHGASVKDNLVALETSQSWTGEHSDVPTSPPEEAMFSIRGLITNQNAKVKKTKYMLFVNGRPVQCPVLKNSIEAIVSSVHAKSSTFWAFLDVRMPYQHVDVNMHPTKSEVMFLFESELVDAVRRAVEDALDTCQAVRTLVKDSVTQAPKLAGNVLPMRLNLSCHDLVAGNRTLCLFSYLALVICMFQHVFFTV